MMNIFIKVFMICLFVLNLNIFASVMMECVNLGEGDIDKIQITSTTLTEFYADNTSDVRDILPSEFENNEFKLSKYYGYTRTLFKNEGNWFLKWGCGESFQVSCTLY